MLVYAYTYTHMSFSTQRKERIEAIEEEVKEKEPAYSQMIAEIQYDFGVSEAKAEEYIEVLLEAGKVTKNDKGNLEAA